MVAWIPFEVSPYGARAKAGRCSAAKPGLTALEDAVRSGICAINASNAGV